VRGRGYEEAAFNGDKNATETFGVRVVSGGGNCYCALLQVIGNCL
jgi:hypothetical protein